MDHFSPAKLEKFLKPRKLFMIVGGLLLLIMLATSIFTVDQAEEAVITRFGKYVRTQGPGLQFMLPFRIERNFNVDVQDVMSQDFGSLATRSGQEERTMLTGDLNVVDVQWTIQYRISDAKAWLFNVQDRSETIRDVSRSVINMLVGDRAIMDVMNVERSAIESYGRILMNETFRSYGLGIDVITVQLRAVMAPREVQPAFEDVNMAMQDRERLISEGQQAYNERIPRARGEADRLVQEAHGYAAERVNMARGDIARFNSVLAEYRNAPAVTRQRLYYEAMEEVFKNQKGAAVIDHNLDNFLPMSNIGGR